MKKVMRDIIMSTKNSFARDLLRKFSQYFLVDSSWCMLGSNKWKQKKKRLSPHANFGVIGSLWYPGPSAEKTLMAEPLVNSALAQFMCEKLPSPEMVSWEQFDYCKGLQHVLQPLSNYFAKTLSSTIFLLHSLKSLLGSWIAWRLSLTSNNLFDFIFMFLAYV